MGHLLGRFCDDTINAVEVCKALPAKREKSGVRRIPADEVIALLDQTLESAMISEFFKDDPRTPRYFVRVIGSKGMHTVEIQPEYAFFGDWVYTPGRELWKLLEHLSGLASFEPRRA